MLHPYAIEPDALAATWKDCRIVLDLMGFQHGRAIAAYPTRKRWKALIRAACKANADLPDRDRRRILRKLDQSNAKIVRADAPDEYDDAVLPAEERWVRNAVARQTEAQAFHAILATRNPEGHRDVVLADDVEASHPKIKVSSSADVLRQPEALADHVGRLIRNSRNLLLIDPYFDPSTPRWRPLVQACIDLAGRTAEGRANVTIHTRCKHLESTEPNQQEQEAEKQEFQRSCRRHLQASGKVASIRVCRWLRTRDHAHDFHDRYLLTNRGGYNLGTGFDQRRGASQRVRLCDDQECEDVRERFDDDDPAFEKADEFTVRPDR